MLTQRQEATYGNITPQMEAVASYEGLSPNEIMSGIAKGKIAIPYNPAHKNCKPIGIGKGLKTKVNANIGTSVDFPCIDDELEKLKVCLEAKADTVMDLSTGGEISKIRRKILKNCYLPLGTVPVYQMIVENKMNIDAMFDVIEQQAQEGVDFMTIHCGVTIRSLDKLKKQRRLMDIVSRGGVIMAKWIIDNGKENPFYEYFDRLIKIAVKYDVTLSLGDGMRPGSILDAGDDAQIEELKILAELTKYAWDAGVQVIIEGPGHVPYDQIEQQIKLQREICNEAPFYVLGPLPTDVAPGYDHITAAIGGTLAAFCGADFLCYVTPTEHLGLPDASDVKEGIIASRIAAHCADIAKGVKSAKEWDKNMSKARKDLNWDKQISLAIDPVKALEIHKKRKSKYSDVCSMCGDFCSMKVSKTLLSQ